MKEFRFTRAIVTPTSSAIFCIYWDNVTERAIVEFNNGKRAGYDYMDADILADWLFRSESVGEYYNALVRRGAGFSVPDDIKLIPRA